MPRHVLSLPASLPPHVLGSYLSGALLAGLALVLAGCASSAPTAAHVEPMKAAEAQQVEQAIRQEVRTWEGTPYVLGGQSRRGVDCSALVQAVYRSAFGLELPRTTEDQVREGRRVRKGRLQAGDLVFFRPSAKTRHVGIYLSDGAFAHASTSQGVTVSQLGSAYWRTRYWTARRVLRATLPPAPPDPVPTRRASTAPPSW